MNPSTGLKEAIVDLLEKYNETNIVGLEYAINEDEEGFTLEVTDFIVTEPESGESESISASEHNEPLYCDLNDMLFDYLEEFNGEDQPQYGEVNL